MMYILSLSLLSFSVQGTAGCGCGYHWQPVCSDDGHQFDNPCLAECHGVEAWTEGECQDTCSCGYDYQPVCSEDMRQFDNPCLARCHGVEAFVEEECPMIENVCVLQLTRKECKAVDDCSWSSRKERCSYRKARVYKSQPQSGCECGFDWQPVCGENGKQFDNPCLAKCHGVESWTEGECQDSCACGLDLQPVCSDDMRQFDNPCLAECHGVESWTEGECPDACVCTFDLQPVCSDDLRQFDNPCLAKCHGVEDFTEGECPMIEDVCVLQLTRKDCKAVPDCAWSNRKEQCSYRKSRTVGLLQPQSDCECGFDWQPVCDMHGKQFDNPCLAKCHGVEAWTEGECQDCECGFDWQPVCDMHGKQFDNPCLAKCHGVESWTAGECQDGCACGFDLQPVCSDNMRQFDNPCLAECHGVEAWTEGECPDACECTFDLQPVCSDDMRQFDNPCLAKCHGVEAWTEGECPMIEDVCVLQLARKDCKSIPECVWSRRNESCSYPYEDAN